MCFFFMQFLSVFTNVIYGKERFCYMQFVSVFANVMCVFLLYSVSLCLQNVSVSYAVSLCLC